MKKTLFYSVVMVFLAGLASCVNKDNYTIASRLIFVKEYNTENKNEIWAVITKDTNMMIFTSISDTVVELNRCLHIKSENYPDFKKKFEDKTIDWETIEKEATTKAIFDYETKQLLSIPCEIVLGKSQHPIKYINEGAFSNWTGLFSIEIPKTVVGIGESGFSQCLGLEQIIVQAGNTVFDSRENCNAIIFSNDNKLVFGCKNTIIPNTVTSIGDFAFYGCTGLASISIPNSVTSIGNFAFHGCSELTSISISNSLTSIGFSAFEGCKALVSLEIPNSVTSIGASAFEGCESLTTANISSSVTSIEESLYKDCKLLTSIEIPNSVTSIGESAFEGCESLWSINIPSSVKEIGRDAFENCTGLAYLEIPNSVTSIGSGAFNHCKGLASIQIPNSVTSIGMCAFYDCSNVTSVDIPQNIKEIKCDGISGTSIDIFDRSIRLVEQLQGTWEWSGYIYGSRAWDRLEISDGQIVAYSSNGVLDQGSFNIDWDNNTIHFGTYSYLDFRFNFYSGWEGLTLYFDKKMVKNIVKYQIIHHHTTIIVIPIT